ncbi:MAG TPA: putative metalloprotease CJM1_0395 family protein [Rhodocyclaceae bacterium]|nr:putative metalloprotease CJM1_0395 family protein [Rhodocyclaceae bacterium]
MISKVPDIGFDKLQVPPWQDVAPRAARDIPKEPDPPTEESSTKVTLELTDDQRRQLEAMAATDRKVRAHEQAHINVGRELVLSGPTYQFETGPDGKNYAVAGEVEIDTSPGKTPEETVPKAQRIRATALAPPDPSPQDQRVAAIASQMEMDASAELALKLAEERSASDGRGEAARQAYQSAAMPDEASATGFFALA